MIRFIRRTFSLIDRPAKVRFVLFTVGSIAVAALEGLSVSLVFPLTQLLVGGADTPMPSVVSVLERFTDVSTREEAAAILSVLVLVILMIKGASALLLLRWSIGNSLRQEARVATLLFRRYLLAPRSFHLSRNSAELQRTLNESLLLVFRRALPFVLAAAADCVTLLAVAAVIVLQDPQVALLAIGYFALVGLVYHRLIGGRQRLAAKRAHNEVAERYRQVQEAVRATKELAILHRQDHFVDRFYETKLQLVAAQRVLAFFQLAPRHLLDLALILGAAVIATYTFTTRPSHEALASLGLFLAASFRLVVPLNRVMGTFTLTRTAEPAIEQVLHDLAELDRVQSEPTTPSAKPLGPTTVELRDVRFRYEEADVDVLDGVSLLVEPGEDVGIVGTSGAGKSTLLDVLLGLLQPTSGDVLVGGRPLRECRAEWQLSIGYVPQDILLIDDTLRANIAFGVNPEQIDEDRVRETVRLAQLDSFVASVPGGLGARVGELGVRISGGQRQRLGLARALYHRPSVLVLDEATSALDTETEGRVMTVIDALSSSMTIITVSHRLSTLRHCDRIYFLREHRVGAVGTFDELYASEPDFAHLVTQAQLSFTGAPGGAGG